ncbi:MAG: LuxR C-terminal-related transcriptional regulator, partial [Actinomycetota bacterium]|nr:LuxR C-terminal-related transcriptional regulator [Actinomycetota bacterium]
EAMAVGSALDADMLCALLGADPDDLVDIVEAGRATGLLTDDGELIPLIRSLVLRLMPVLRSRTMQQRLAGLQLDRGGSVLAAGRQLLGTGASGSRVAAVLEAAAEEALAQSATLAAELFAGAVEAGADRRQLAARRAHAVALAGDLDQALRLADGVLSDPLAPDRPLAVTVASAALAHRGLLDRSANLARSLPVDAATGPALAVPALVGTGVLDDARAVLEAITGVPASATLFAEAQVLMARGMVETIVGSPTAALSQLARSAGLLEPVGKTSLLPDTPAALTALVALHCGELSTADSALRRAVTEKLGGRPAQLRHLLLHGWVLMARGKLGAARRTLDKAAHVRQQLEPRDELFAAALAVGLARREDDAAALASAWDQARLALVRHPVDLYTLRPLGELAVAAARLGEREWITPHLKEAENLLEELGGPALWTASLRWDELHAAMVADQLPEAQRHAAVLRDIAASSTFAAVLSRAAESWLEVLSGTVDIDEVQAAARSLHGVGLAWEAASLVSQAAGRTTDRRMMMTLLATARSLHGSTSGTTDTSAIEGADPRVTAPTTGSAPTMRRPAPAPGPVGVPRQHGPGKPVATDRAVLSDREIEVGELILSGLTYKQIGQRLFISAKTVEHHVARMRQRLGVDSRNELFSRLRSVIESGGAA